MGTLLAALLPVIFLAGVAEVAVAWLWMVGASRENDE